jgi:hypothetical protein
MLQYTFRELFKRGALRATTQRFRQQIAQRARQTSNDSGVCPREIVELDRV